MPPVITTLSEESIRRIARELFAKEREAIQLMLRRAQRNEGIQPGKVQFRNGSGETIPPYAVMRVTNTESRMGLPLYVVNKPSSSFQRFYLVNGSQRVGDTSTALGYGTWLNDASWVLYDTADGTPVFGQVWGPVDGSWKLRRHYYGFHILGNTNTSTSGSERVIALQQMVMNVIGKTDSSISKGSSGIVSMWKGDRSADTSIDISSVANPFATSIASGKWVRVVWDAETPSATAAEC